MILKPVVGVMLKVIAGLLIPVIVYLFAAVALSWISTNPDPLQCDHREEIYVGSNGIHLYYILTSAQASEVLDGLTEVPQTASHVSFGWGDKEFYLETPTWDDLRIGVAMRALFTKSETAMHVTYYDANWPEWRAVKICDRQMNALAEFIRGAFELRQGKVQELDHTGYTADDHFFEANGSYSLFTTSNNWVNIGLKKADVKTAIWSPFPFGVMIHLDPHERPE